MERQDFISLFYFLENMSNSKNFLSSLKISDHFDNVINEIDIKTETLLQDQSLIKETRDKLNVIRE